MEKRYIRKDRSTVWINLTVGLVRDEAGSPQYFVSVVEDIAARKLGQRRSGSPLVILAANAPPWGSAFGTADQVGQAILQPVSSSVPATLAPLTTSETLNRSSGSLSPFETALPTKRSGISWFWPAR